MNPINLLTQGRTLRSLKERPGRYKLSHNKALPNFSGAKNPFPTTSHPEPQKAQAALFEPANATPAPRNPEGTSGLAKVSAMAKAMVEKPQKEEPKKPVRTVP